MDTGYTWSTVELSPAVFPIEASIVDEELKFRSEEARQAYAMKMAVEHVQKLTPDVIEKCGKDRLLNDFQQEFLRTLPPVSRIRDKL